MCLLHATMANCLDRMTWSRPAEVMKGELCFGMVGVG